MAATIDPTMLQVGTRIMNRRVELELTQSELAVQADLPYQAISEIESGKRNMRMDTLPDTNILKSIVTMEDKMDLERR